MDRRGFLGSMLAACAAPAIVRASSLMKCSGIIVPSQGLLLPATALGGNRLLTIDMITREALAILERELLGVNKINDDYSWAFAGIGKTVAIRHPRLELVNG